jgi:predicted PurR-regulated permease PerM
LLFGVAGKGRKGIYAHFIYRVILLNDDRITTRELRRILYSTVMLAVMLFYAFRFIGGITRVLLIFAITLLFALVLNPIVAWAEKHKIPRILSSLVLVFGVITAVIVLILYVAPLVYNQVRQLALQLPAYYSTAQSWLTQRFPEIADDIPTNLGNITNNLDIVIGGVVGYATNVLEIAVALIVVTIGTIYLLSNPQPLAQGLIGLFPQEKHDKVVNVMRRLGEQMSAWAKGTLVGMFAIFSLTWIALTIIDVQPAFLFALIAGLLEVVPTVGPVLSAVPPVFAALITDPVKAIYVIAAFLVIQQLENHLIVPLVQSSALKLHPFSLIFVILVMGTLFGIIGIFLAAPTTAVVKVLYEELYLKAKADDGREVEKKAEKIVKQEQADASSEE